MVDLSRVLQCRNNNFSCYIGVQRWVAAQKKGCHPFRMALVLSGLLIRAASAFVQVLVDSSSRKPIVSASLGRGPTSRARSLVIEPDSTVSTTVFSKVSAKRIIRRCHPFYRDA